MFAPSGKACHKIIDMRKLGIIHLKSSLVIFPASNQVQHRLQIVLRLFRCAHKSGSLIETITDILILLHVIQGLVSTLVQFFILMSVHTRQADPDGKLRLLQNIYLLLLPCKSIQYLIHHINRRIPAAHSLYKIEEFIAACSAYNVLAADLTQYIRCHLQCIITCQMSMNLIDPLKMIQIENHQTSA